MKKRLLASLLAAAMTLTMAPAAFAAEADDVAVQSDPTASSAAVDSNTLQYKINWDTEGKIVLDKDYTESVKVEKGEHTIDLNGHTITNTDGQNTITVAKGASLTIEGEGTVDNVSNAKAAIWNNGTCTLNGGTYDRTKEDGKQNSNTYYTLLNHGSMTVNEDVAVNNNGGFSSLFENGYYSYGSQYKDNENSAAPELTINGGKFTGGINTVKNDDGATLTINGGTFTNYTQAAFQNHNIATINGGTFDGASVYAILNCGSSCTADADQDKHQLTINDGNFKGNILRGSYNEDGTYNDFGTISISGGNFTVDPTDFCAEGKIGVPSDNEDYPYTVADVVKNVEVAPPAAPAVKAETGKYDEESEEAIKMAKAAESIAAEDSKTEITGLDDVANIEATKITDDDVTKATEALKNAGVTPSEDEKVTLYVQSYLDITVSDIDLFADNMDAPIALTLDIVPMVKKIASTATNAEGIKTEGDDKNAVQVGEAVVEVNTPVTITIPMPEDFPAKDGDKIVVKHEKNGQFICYHAATYNATDKTVTFTNNKGFSTFTIKFDSRSAKIQFTDKDGKNIDEQTEYDATKVNETLPTTEAPSGYKFTGWSFKSDDETISGTYTVMTEELLNKLDNPFKVYTATPVFASTSSSSGGSSGGGSSSSSSTSTVSASKANNGSVSLDKTSASKGSTVTITVKPDKGYKLDKLTVTDSKGNAITVTNKGNNKYTFTMPDGKVTVTPTFVAEQTSTEQPSDTKSFSDVKSADWFASAVDYVVDKGMMNGVGNNKFAPNDSTTRGMLMTVIARYAGQDTTGSNPWYQKGMEWAKANGVSDGTAPNANITREQLVTMLYRYAKSAGKDVSIGEDTNILSYTDATTVSEYAIPAMQWACGAGIVNGSNGKLLPKNNATRAEVAAILMRFCENVK